MLQLFFLSQYILIQATESFNFLVPNIPNKAQLIARPVYGKYRYSRSAKSLKFFVHCRYLFMYIDVREHITKKIL